MCGVWIIKVDSHSAMGMQTPAEMYRPLARRLDERIKPRLYEVGIKTKRLDVAGFILFNSNSCYLGESLMGVDVAIEESVETGLLAIRYANVKPGWLNRAPNARLRPAAYTERWESKPGSKTGEK
jgi:hypothetical protein